MQTNLPLLVEDVQIVGERRAVVHSGATATATHVVTDIANKAVRS